MSIDIFLRTFFLNMFLLCLARSHTVSKDQMMQGSPQSFSKGMGIRHLCVSVQEEGVTSGPQIQTRLYLQVESLQMESS